MRLLLTFTMIIAFGFAGIAQDNGDAAENDIHNVRTKKHPGQKMNYVKLNLTSLALNNYGLQYERVLSKRFSFAIAGRMMPSSGIPMSSSIEKLLDDDDSDLKDILNNAKISNYAITPEFRLYAGKGYGQGFYVSLFYRYADFDLKNVPVHFDSDLGTDRSLQFSGKVTANTAGILLGVQKNFAKILALDFWLLGPHYGSGQGIFEAKSSTPLTATEQDNIREALEDIDIPVIKQKVEVNENGASSTVDGPWAGIRIGISLGIRF